MWAAGGASRREVECLRVLIGITSAVVMGITPELIT